VDGDPLHTGKGLEGPSFSSNMFDLDKGFLHIFADSIFANLNIAEAFGSYIVRPLDGGGIVIVDSDGTV